MSSQTRLTLELSRDPGPAVGGPRGSFVSCEITAMILHFWTLLD